MGALTREDVDRMIKESKRYLDQLRDYDLGKWRPKRLVLKKKKKIT
jgi:hypothetical protein